MLWSKAGFYMHFIVPTQMQNLSTTMFQTQQNIAALFAHLYCMLSKVYCVTSWPLLEMARQSINSSVSNYSFGNVLYCNVTLNKKGHNILPWSTNFVLIFLSLCQKMEESFYRKFVIYIMNSLNKSVIWKGLLSF